MWHYHLQREVCLVVGDIDNVLDARPRAAILASFFPAMTRPQQRLLSQLATSENEIASGLGQCLEALRLISALPRASPVFVKYTSAASPTIKAFGREHLSRVPLRVCPHLFYFRCCRGPCERSYPAM